MAGLVQLEILGSVPKVVTEADLRQALSATLAQTKQKPVGKINCIFVSRSASQELNTQFAEHNYPTDVLSFNYFEGKSLARDSKTTLAEIAICSEIARVQAKELGNTYSDEIILLLVHGLLHIFGLDHASESDRTSFEHTQSAIMKKLNRNVREFQWSV